MVLPVAEALTTPSLTSGMNPVARQKLKEQYRVAKRYGIKAAWGVVTGSGVLELAKEVAKGEIVKQGINIIRVQPYWPRRGHSGHKFHKSYQIR